MYYRECPRCGANLDPEEHCDCVEERIRQTEVIMNMITRNKETSQYELVMN